MSTTTDTTTALDWEAVARAILHPHTAATLERLAAAPEGRTSPVREAKALGLPLPLAAYHFRRLALLGLAQSAGTRPARGALEHFYRLSDRARA